jgi:hypothetical protein
MNSGVAFSRVAFWLTFIAWVLIQCGLVGETSVPQMATRTIEAAVWRVRRLILHLARIGLSPAEVTELDADRWVDSMISKGYSLRHIRATKTLLWKLLRNCGHTSHLPAYLRRECKYGMRLESFPPTLQKEVSNLLGWKLALFAPGRPTRKVRPATAQMLQNFLSRLYRLRAQAGRYKLAYSAGQ